MNRTVPTKASKDEATRDMPDADQLCRVDSYLLPSPGCGRRAGDEVPRERLRRQMRADSEIGWCTND